MEVNRSGLADVLGVSLPTIDRYSEQGMPALQEGRKGVEWRFDTKACIQWLIELKTNTGSGAGASYESARSREKVAVARMKELELEELEGRMIDIDTVVERVENEYAVVKSRLQAIPGRMAQPLSAVSDASTIEALLKAEVNETLASLSEIDHG
jgi:phage terminase Nu1 subunit (DNA packaging protein)